VHATGAELGETEGQMVRVMPAPPPIFKRGDTHLDPFANAAPLVPIRTAGYAGRDPRRDVSPIPYGANARAVVAGRSNALQVHRLGGLLASPFRWSP
jgi:hypothetical protein